MRSGVIGSLSGTLTCGFEKARFSVTRAENLLTAARRPMEQRRLGRGLHSLLSTDSASDAAPITRAPLEQIVPNRNQPREEFDEGALERLADSIRKNGLLQPIVVRRQGSKFEIIAGERRFRAARKAGLQEVPVVVREDVSDSQLLELALLENVQRVDLNPIEKARGYRKLIQEFHRSQEEIAKSVGQERVTISNTLRLLELPSEMQEAVQRGALSAGHARALLSVPSAPRRRNLFERALREDLSVRQVELLALEEGAQRKPRRTSKSGQPAWISDLEARWRRRLGVRVELAVSGQRSRLTIHCASLDELERVTDLTLGAAGPREGSRSEAVSE